MTGSPNRWTKAACRVIALAAWLSVAVATPCLGDEVGGIATDGAWLDTERAVLGAQASALWTAAQLSDSDVGGVRVDRAGGPSSAGRKVKAGLLSLLLPGAGQYYNGDRDKAWVFAGVEAAVWASYFTFDAQGGSRTDTYEEYAVIYADVAGERSDDAYWRALGRYLDSDAYNESLLREARAFDIEPVELISAEDSWQWRNEDYFRVYQELRADAARAYDRRDFMTFFAIVNRVVAVYDAVRNSVDDKLQGEVLGFHVEMSVSPSLRHPRTGCTFTRRF